MTEGKYDFDTPVERRGSDSFKWAIGENEIPMWVADMDFKAAPEIINALEKRLSHPVYGYIRIPDEWYLSYINWWKTRHGFTMEKEWLTFCYGVIPALSSIVKSLSEPGQKVLLQPPVYNHFYNSIRNNSRIVFESPLVYRDGAYEIDFKDLEEKMADPDTPLMILSNPQNPVGKIWDAETLSRIGELAKKHNVVVLSDEIHCDITEPGCSYVPFAGVSNICRTLSVTCIAPTKAFNLAGIKSAAVMVPNTDLRKRIFEGLSRDEIDEPNILSCPAAIAAFNEGGDWLDELCEYISENRKFTAEFVEKELPGLHLVKGEATYLLGLDVSSLNLMSRELSSRLRKNAGVYFSPGADYGERSGAFLRLNVACPRSQLKEALQRLKEGIARLHP